MELTKILGEAGLTLATDILLTQGKLRYVDDWEREITDRLKSRQMPSTPATVMRPNRKGQRTAHQLRAIEVPAGKARRFDYAGCKKKAPLLYSQNVTILAPDSPLTLTFPKSDAWDQIKSEGWQRFAEGYAARRAVPEYWGVRDQAERLSEARTVRAALKLREKTERMELAELIIERDTSCRPYTYGGGILRVRESSPRQKIDLDRAEQDARLRDFVIYSDRAAFTKFLFLEPGFDPEGDKEPFEGD